MAQKVGPDSPQGTGSTYGTMHSKEGPQRRIRISVCSSSKEESVSGFRHYLQTLRDRRQDLIESVEFHPLPYNNIDKYKFPEDKKVDVMLLCHSIHNRRFAITDVDDALYNKYLRYCTKKLGQERVAVIAHDFEDLGEEAEKRRMESFRSAQPTTFEQAALAFTAGRLDGSQPEISEENLQKLEHFFNNAASQRSSNTSHPCNCCVIV
ncbi:uncharacterized protein [Diadema antillarum]|uniref:uncharacterized protein n=1 Tax=Diadema antillarum TaxID=105358 RepID=UPI003A8A3B6E